MSSLPLSKRCGKCKQEKAVSEFGIHKQTRGGLRSTCKECRRPKVLPPEWEALPGEMWKPVTGFEDYYAVSSFGRVASYLRGRSAHESVLLKAGVGNVGYRVVTLAKPGIGSKRFLVHVLVLEAFVGPRPHKFVANHRDGVKTNNTVENLEWVTYSENLKHAYVKGLNPGPPRVQKLPKKPRAKLSEVQVREIRALKGTFTSTQLGEMYGVHASAIKKIWDRSRWAYVE